MGWDQLGIRDVGDGGDSVIALGQVRRSVGERDHRHYGCVPEPDRAHQPDGAFGGCGRGTCTCWTGRSVRLRLVPRTGNAYQVGFVNPTPATPERARRTQRARDVRRSTKFCDREYWRKVQQFVYLNGNSSTLAFSTVKTGTSPSLPATVYNIGEVLRTSEAGEADRNRGRIHDSEQQYLF